MSPNHRTHHIVIIGGGTGGIAVAARLLRADPRLDVAIIDGATKHYYQPLWTLVGAGEVSRESTERSQSDVIPDGATWIADRVESIDPPNCQVVTASGDSVGYDVLVVCPGIEIGWSKIPGLAENLGSKQICSNYSYQHVDYTWRCLREFSGGTALFTQPSTPIKCAGAPQKIAYLAADGFRNRRGMNAASARVVFASGLGVIFGVPTYAATLSRVIERYGIEAQFSHDLCEIRADEKVAVFRKAGEEAPVEIAYDMIHAVPPMGPPEFVAASALAGDGGWVEVDKHTCRHVRFDNVFALGDSSSLPTSRTGAAARKQAPVVAENVRATLAGKAPTASYDGYTSCPLVTGYGKLVMAEFGYDGKLMETFPFDQSEERWSMYMLKKHLLPRLYWHGMMKGRL